MNIGIRRWRPADAQDLADALNNKLVQDNLRDGLPFPYTASDAIDYINSMLAADPDDVYAFAVTLDDRAIGSIGAFRKGNIHRYTAEVGYYIAQPYWGKGIGTAALRLLCDHIFQNSDIMRLFAEPFSYNTASCRILEKAGFCYEGTMKSNAVKNGAVIDMRLYALVRGL